MRRGSRESPVPPRRARSGARSCGEHTPATGTFPYLHSPRHDRGRETGLLDRRRRGRSARTDVLDRVCAQVAELHAGGENVVLVTSGAIARGMRALETRAAPLGDRRAAGGLRGRAGQPLPGLRGAAREGRRPRSAGPAHGIRPPAAHQLPERPPDAQPAARLAGCPGRERERHDGHRRDHLRRQRLPRGAGRDHAGGEAARPAHRSDRALHEGPAPPPGRRARAGSERGVAARRRTRSASTPRPLAWAACAARWRRRGWREPRGSPP